MKFIQSLYMGVTYLLCLFLFSTASAQTLPNGTYAKTNFGAINVSCVSAILCFATYEDGKSFMYLTSPRQNDRFTGYWAEPEASQTCPQAQNFPNIHTNAWGNVDITFDFSANSWTGFWGYCEEHPNREFDGARDPQSTQIEDGNATDLDLAERLLGSWLPTEDSGARRNDMFTFNPDSTFVISDGSSNSPEGYWILKNRQLFLDGQSDPVPLAFAAQNIFLAGNQFQRETLNDENYNVQGILGGIKPSGVFVPNWRVEGSAPKVGNYALRYIVLGLADSFRPDASSDAGTAVYVEFWNETETVKEDEAGNGYRDDIVAFEATGYEVGPNSLLFHGYHPDWGDLYFSAQFDGDRVAKQTSYELGGGARPANADKPIIVGDMLVKGHIFHDVELYLAFLH
jgi:hypothetical protein